MKVSMRIEGLDALAKALDGLPMRVQRREMRAILTEAAEPIRQQAEADAPHAPGAPDIKANIGISVAQTSRYIDLKQEVAAVAIGPVEGFAYGLPLELGTIDTAAQPFMRPAFDEAKNETLEMIADGTWDVLFNR